MDELITLEEMSDLLKVSVSTLRLWKRQGGLPEPHRMTGRTLRWNRTEIETWISSGCPSQLEWSIMKSKEVIPCYRNTGEKHNG
jgi:excisionase family DNA binding protein